MDRNSFVIPAAIVIAAALIAGAIYLNGSNTKKVDTQPEADIPEVTMRPVDSTDHIRGNPNAPILLVEYSDYDCPFCSQFHETMKRIMDTYGTTGKVAWVYRHFPLAQLHPNAAEIAAASECVAELGGNDAFWKFTDLVFTEKPIESQNGQQYIGSTDITRLGEFAERAGVDKGRFELCHNSDKYKDAISASVAEAQKAGGTGTPHTLIVAGNQVLGTIPGAYPFDDFRGSTGEMQSGMDTIIAALVAQSSGAVVPPTTENTDQ